METFYDEDELNQTQHPRDWSFHLKSQNMKKTPNKFTNEEHICIKFKLFCFWKNGFDDRRKQIMASSTKSSYISLLRYKDWNVFIIKHIP